MIKRIESSWAIFGSLLFCSIPSLAQESQLGASSPDQLQEEPAIAASAEGQRGEAPQSPSKAGSLSVAPTPAPVHLEESSAPSDSQAASYAHQGVAPSDELPDQEARHAPPQAGMDPSLPQFDAAPTAAATAVQNGGDWEFEFHGFLRSPMRMGIGPKNDGTEGVEEHSPPRVPDLSFTDWRYTHNVPGPWTQLLFSYGNDRVKGTVGIAAFTHTNAGYRNLQANLGINEAFLTLNFPDTFGRYGGLTANVGSFSNRYGTAGKYNAGKYNTYLFGRTRVAGETLTAGLYLTPDITLTLEHGIGAKLDVIPSETVTPRPDYLPYAGPEPQGTTWVNHAHVTLGIVQKLTLGAHYLHTRSPDDRQQAGAPSNPGKMSIAGGEIRFDGDALGHGYVGYSHIDAEEILSLADAVEVLHSFAGWNFKNNFFGRYNPRTGQQAPDTSGKVDSLLFQYDLSLGALARLPSRFRGNGPDVDVSVFGMLNKTTSDNSSHTKFKWGAEAIYRPFAVAGIGLRYDLVQPNLADKDESFAVISPKLVFATRFITKEEVTVQYSRYFLGDKAYPSYPYTDIDNADQNVLMIVGRMWW